MREPIGGVQTCGTSNAEMALNGRRKDCSLHRTRASLDRAGVRKAEFLDRLADQMLDVVPQIRRGRLFRAVGLAPPALDEAFHLSLQVASVVDVFLEVRRLAHRALHGVRSHVHELQQRLAGPQLRRALVLAALHRVKKYAVFYLIDV